MTPDPVDFGELLATRELRLLEEDGKIEPVGLIDISQPRRQIENKRNETWVVNLRFRNCELEGHTRQIIGGDAFQALHYALVAAGCLSKLLPDADRIHWVKMGDGGFPTLTDTSTDTSE